MAATEALAPVSLQPIGPALGEFTRAIAQVAATKKAVVGLMSGLPVLGRPLNPMTKQQPTEPWVLGSELKRIFDVRRIEVDAKQIPEDVQVLLVIHPRNITEETEYALDQFVLRGGKLIAFLDPYAYFDQQPVEAQASLSACLAACRVTSDARWLGQARACFDWFFGKNDLGLSLYDPTSGGCRDALQVDRTNQNQGAESTLAYLLSLLELRLFEATLRAFQRPAERDTAATSFLSNRS